MYLSTTRKFTNLSLFPLKQCIHSSVLATGISGITTLSHRYNSTVSSGSMEIKTSNSIQRPNILQISHNYPQFISYENPETEMFPRSFTKSMLIKRPATSETDFRFNVPTINTIVHHEVKDALNKNLGIENLRVHQQEMYGRIVLSTQNAIAAEYSKERNNFALGLQKWAFQLWRLKKKVQLGTMYFLKKHQEHVLKAIERAESLAKTDTCWHGPRGSGKTLSYLLAALETAKCYKAWEQDYVQPGYRILILVPSNYQAENVGALLDSAVYPPFEKVDAENAKEADSTLQSYKNLKRLQKNLDAKRRAIDTDNQNDFAFMEYEGLINLDGLDENKVTPYRHINHLVLTSNGDLEKQIDAMDFSVPEIVIATPDQLVKHLSNSNYFNNLKLLILDDVQGLATFEKEIQEIKKHLKPVHSTVYISDAEISEVPEVLKSERPIDFIQLSILKRTQKLTLPHHVIPCSKNGSMQSELISLINKHRGKKVLITHQNNELLQLVSELLEGHDIRVCTATELESSEERELTLRYYNSRTNGVLISHDTIALNSVKADSVDVLINLGVAQGAQSSYVQLFDLLSPTAQGSFFLSLGEGEKSFSSILNVDMKSKKPTTASNINQERINEIAEHASMTTSASIVNYFRNVMESPKNIQWNKNSGSSKFLENPSGTDAESSKEAVHLTVQLYKSLGINEASFPKSSVFQAQSVAAENAMREAGLSKWTYHKKALQMLKVPSFE